MQIVCTTLNRLVGREPKGEQLLSKGSLLEPQHLLLSRPPTIPLDDAIPGGPNIDYWTC